MNILKLYNTATRQKENFSPINPDSIKLYVCGPTVYNYVHIGNARPFVAFDTLYRVLDTLYPSVIYARNITDIDDKIMRAAREEGVEIGEIAQRYTQAFHDDMAQLNILPPGIEPKATDSIQAMIEMIEKLIANGHAYAAEGHALFKVQSMEDYGKLSNRALDDMLEGARVEVAPYKEYAGDFVLWKPSGENEPGWNSPWGRGRPGWHLECSAMIKKHLGTTIDIHGGGRDLIFPHHENELAQSRCAHGGEDFVNYWMHNGFVNIDGEKMAKSLGNFRTVRELLSRYRGEVLRFALLSAQYRSDMDFSAASIDQAKASLDTLYCALRNFRDLDGNASVDTIDLDGEPAWLALLDDLNTPLAISELHALAGQLQKAYNNKNEKDDTQARKLKAKLLALGWHMGILQNDPEEWFQKGSEDEIPASRIEALIEERQQAKLAKNYGRADEIRQQLRAQGVELEDLREGTRWNRE